MYKKIVNSNFFIWENGTPYRNTLNIKIFLRAYQEITKVSKTPQYNIHKTEAFLFIFKSF